MNTMRSQPQVLIVGAGIIGIACAHYLNEAGYRVAIIDKGRAGSGCSSGNCGHICPSHVLPLNEPGAVMTGLKSMFNPNSAFKIRPRPSVNLIRWLWEFTLRCTHTRMLEAADDLKLLLDSSMDEYRKIVQGLDCDWQDKGLLYVLRSKRGVDSFARSEQMISKEFGVSARYLSGADLTALDPAYKSELAGAFHYQDDAHLHPDRLITGWTESLKQSGVSFLENCELISINKGHGKIDSLHTSAGIFRADQYVIAAGAWSSKLAGELDCAVPMQPGKGYSVTMERPKICPSHPAFFPEHGIGVTPFAQGYRIGSMMELNGFDASIPQRRIKQLKDSAKPYLKEPYSEHNNTVWQGWRPMTWDSLPIIDHVPELGNVFLATGHNMLGVTMAPGTGRLLCELIQGKPTHIDASPFSASRFK